MTRSWAEKFAVVAMVLGLVALVAVSVAALLIAAGVFICLVALLYIINPAGMRAALRVLADKPDAWLTKAHEWLDGLKEILSAFQSAAQAAAGVSQEEKKQGYDEATPEPKPQDKDEMEQTPNRN